MVQRAYRPYSDRSRRQDNPPSQKYYGDGSEQVEPTSQQPAPEMSPTEGDGYAEAYNKDQQGWGGNQSYAASASDGYAPAENRDMRLSSGAYSKGGAYSKDGAYAVDGGNSQSPSYGTPPPQSAGFGTGQSAQYQPSPDVRPGFTNGKDIGERLTNDRGRIAGQGDRLDQDYQNDRVSSGAQRDRYRGQADRAYEGIANGRGGYNSDERGDILGRGGLDSLQQTGDERQSNYATDAERAGSQGNPDEANQWFDPAWQDGINTERNQRINESVGQFGQNMRGTVDQDRLRMDSSYGSRNNELFNSSDRSARGVLDSSDAGVRGAIDPNRLRQSEDFAGKYRLTPEQQRDMVTSTGMDVGYQGRVNADRVKRSAANSGYGSPMALASGLRDLQTASAADAGDAMFKARIGANSEAARREMGIEGNRQDAERTYAGMRSNAEMEMGSRRLNDSRSSVGRRYDANRDTETMRLGSERDISNRRMDVEGQVGQMGYDAADRTGRNSTDTARYIGDTGSRLYQQSDDRRVDRSNNARDNRQGSERYNQEQRYGRGMDSNDRTSQRTAGVAGARRDDEREYRGFSGGMYRNEADAYQNSNQNRNTNYGTSSGAVNNSTGNAANYEAQKAGQGFRAQIARGVGNFIGGLKPPEGKGG